MRQRIKTDLKNHQLTLILFQTFSFLAVPIILHNKCALHYLKTNGNDNIIYEKAAHVHNYLIFWKGLYFNYHDSNAKLFEGNLLWVDIRL